MINCVQDDVEQVLQLQYYLDVVSMSIYWHTFILFCFCRLSLS